MESAATTGGDDESLADEKLGQQTGRKQQEWWLGLGILVDIGEGRQGQVRCGEEELASVYIGREREGGRSRRSYGRGGQKRGSRRPVKNVPR